MPLAIYTKAPPQTPHQVLHNSTRYSRVRKLAPVVLVTIGSLLIANVAWPILHYQLLVSPNLSRSQLVTPININNAVFNQSAPAIAGAQPQQTAPQVLGQEIDYTKASTWFPTTNFTNTHSSKITHYTISIPAVNIEDAVVAIGGEDLAESLIHYPGTANPGQLGSPVIFGHSVLRQFYNPSKNNPRRYNSIFSKIMTLDNGDDIIIDFDGIRYKYVVKDKLEIKPEDVHILGQRYNNRQLKLITCVPEGTYLRRGVIVAQLQDINQPIQTN